MVEKEGRPQVRIAHASVLSRSEPLERRVRGQFGGVGPQVGRREAGPDEGVPDLLIGVVERALRSAASCPRLRDVEAFLTLGDEPQDRRPDITLQDEEAAIEIW